jgi:O-antigen ligase
VKWIVLAVALAGIMPLADWLRRNPHETPKIWILMGFLPFAIGTFHLLVGVVSWAGWPGYVKGAEVSILDILAAALYLSLPRSERQLPFRLSMALYFLAVLGSTFQSSVPMSTIFYAWQLARMFLVYAVVVKAIADERVVLSLLSGMTIGLCLEACDVVWERFGLGVLQTGGTMGHQNFLGLMTHFVTFPWMSLLLAGERGWFVVGPLAGLVIAVLTVSRGTIGLLAVGYVGLFGLSALRRWTPRKALLMVGGLGVAVLLSPIVLISFEKRFSEHGTTQDSTYDERAAFEAAAAMIVSDHPFGIGANNYVVVANSQGYNERAGVTWVPGSESANVHNVYYLVTAETGYIGLITFLFMLAQPMIVAFRCGWRCRADRRGDLLLGLGMSLFIVYVHSYFEWVFITFPAQYMLALEAGMIAGLAQRLGYWRRSSVSNRVAVGGAIGPLEKVDRN